MEELAALLAAIGIGLATFVIGATWYGLKLLGHGSLAAFSARHRQRLKTDWRESLWNKVLMVSGAVFYLGALVWAGQFWWSLAHRSPPEKSRFGLDDLPLTESEKAELMLTKTMPELHEKARELGEQMRKAGRWPLGIRGGFSEEPGGKEP